MSARAPLATREQRIVARLQAALPSDQPELKRLRARALDLPAMLRRHGLMHVLLFLVGKNDNDRKLASFLHQGIVAALDPMPVSSDTATYAESLAGMELPLYLLQWEAAQESATWLKLLVEARTKSAPAAAPPPENGEVQE